MELEPVELEKVEWNMWNRKLGTGGTETDGIGTGELKICGTETGGIETG